MAGQDDGWRITGCVCIPRRPPRCRHSCDVCQSFQWRRYTAGRNYSHFAYRVQDKIALALVVVAVGGFYLATVGIRVSEPWRNQCACRSRWLWWQCWCPPTHIGGGSNAGACGGAATTATRHHRRRCHCRCHYWSRDSKGSPESEDANFRIWALIGTIPQPHNCCAMSMIAYFHEHMGANANVNMLVYL